MARKKSENGETVFEVVHGSVAFGTGEKPTRNVGDEILDSELDERLKKMLLDDGTIRDTAAPLSPADVSVKLADHLIELAQGLGLITNDGSTYSFGGQDHKGLDALRAAATTTAVKSAILDAFAGKNAAITELTGQLSKP